MSDYDPYAQDLVEQVNYGFMMSLSSESYCFNFDTWCQQLTGTSLSTADLESKDFAYTWLSTHSMCYLAREVLDHSTAMVIATGSLNLTYNGNDKQVHTLDMLNSVNHATLGIADAFAMENPNVTASNYTIAYTETADACKFLEKTDVWSKYMCGLSIGGSQVVGAANANGLSAGSAVGRAGHVENANSVVRIKGENIRQFSTIVNIAVESFAFTDTKATVEAMTQAYLLAYSTSFTKTCYRFVESMCDASCASVYGSGTDMHNKCSSEFCLAENCAMSSDYKPLNATSVGQSFGESFGLSFDQTAIHFSTYLTYQFDPDLSVKDRVKLGYAGLGASPANSSIVCKETDNTRPAQAESRVQKPTWWGKETR
jgi:hypothetical protein